MFECRLSSASAKRALDLDLVRFSNGAGIELQWLR
eukprot:COSAG02_NODE_28578_length_587_cov_0.639344_1_plen_34_part_01